MSVYRRIFKQGNSLVVALPSYMVEACGVQSGDYFYIEQIPGPCLKFTGSSCASVAALSAQMRLRERERSEGRDLKRGRRVGEGVLRANGAQSEEQDLQES